MENVFGVLAATGISSFFLIFLVFLFFFYFLLFAAGITIFVFWIIALVDVIKRKDEDFPSGGENIKLVWLLLIIFIWVSSIPYYFLVIKVSRDKEVKKKKIESK